MNESDKAMLEWVRFVATKFVRNVEGWTYSRDKGDLEHIRYRSDHTGHNSLWNRIKFTAQGIASLHKRDSLFSSLRPFSAEWFISAWVTARVRLMLGGNLPDGLVNGSIITHWEEDGEYIVMMGPTVGVKVLDFLEAEPDNKHAQAILAEMRRVREMSWGAKEEQ